MEEAPRIEVATEPAEESNVTPFRHLVPRTRRVPPMTDEEIIAFRQLRAEFEAIKKSCPLAQRALSK